jgi:DNA-binding winged helix-turn-helix (wHTH) protein/TolB-like protein
MLDKAHTSRRCYRFGPFQLDIADQQLYKDGQPVDLPRRLVRALELLVEHHGKTLEKNYLMQQLWPNTVVEENSLTVIISMLRKVLGDDGEPKKYIQTKSGRGYRFIAEITETPLEEADTRVVQKDVGATATDAVPRFQTLRRYAPLPMVGWTAGLLLLLLAFGVYQWASRNSPQTIAVLPFQFGGAERDDGYLGLGMADGLITRLRNIRQVAVKPTTAVAKYRGVAHDARVIGSELHVASLLDGTVERRDDEVWLRVKLLRVRDGALLWSDVYHGAFADILTLQDEIAERAARALTVKVSSAEHQSMHRHYTSSSDAYQHYIAGRYNCSTAGDKRFLEKGISLFQQATAKDPQFALAYASLAACYVELTFAAEQPAEAELLLKAELAAQRALEIDPNVQEAYLPLAIARTYSKWDYSGAEAAFRKSIDLAPGSVEAHVAYAQFLTGLGRFQEAEREAHKAAELDPFSWSANLVVNEVYFFARRYSEAAEGFEKSRVVDLDSAGWYLAWIYASRGRPTPLIQELVKAQAAASRKALFTGELAYAYALQGMDELAESHLRQLAQYPESIDDYQISLIYVATGDRDMAFQFLARAKEKRSMHVLDLKVDPRLDSLRSDARFGELLRSVHLGP